MQTQDASDAPEEAIIKLPDGTIMLGTQVKNSFSNPPAKNGVN